MNTFNDIKHMPLRVFNRTVTLNNIYEDSGEVGAKAYIEQFTQGERKQIFLMQNFIKAKGQDEARKFATNGLEVVQ